MKQPYKILLLLILITTGVVSAQEVVVYKKDFEVNKEGNVTVNLFTDDVLIENSIDDKVHVNYSVSFTKYSKRQIQNYVETIKVTTEKEDGNLIITSRGENLKYRFFEFVTMTNRALNLRSKDTINRRKTKDSIVNEIHAGYKPYLRSIKTKPNKAKYKYEKSKGAKPKFLIKVPEGVILKVNGSGSQINFSKIENQTELKIKRGGVILDRISNSKSRFHIKDGYFYAEEIEGAQFYFNDVYKALIGSIKNATIENDFSKVEIAELKENVKINDYNGVFWFYNLNNNASFNLDSDYSKLNIYGKNENNNLINAFKSKVKDDSNPAANFTLEDPNINLKVANGLIYYHN
ncbi:hypothetical protein IZU89_02535 [Cellulophaga lytica]|uniref:hypothetical protein n=1 Tax=Cellulophaga lytica TaxID=979 RepID=UPI0032E490FF